MRLENKDIANFVLSIFGLSLLLFPFHVSESFLSVIFCSALRDRRFPPIQAKELPSLECTVSILTDYETANHYLDWEVSTYSLFDFCGPLGGWMDIFNLLFSAMIYCILMQSDSIFLP